MSEILYVSSMDKKPWHTLIKSLLMLKAKEDENDDE